MSPAYRLLANPFLPMIAFATIFTAMLAAYIYAGLTPSPVFELVASFGWTILVAYWIVADARRRQRIPCFDFGFFCYLFLPIAVPWYCFWSRGRRGILSLIAIMAIWLLPYVAASIFWLALYG